MTLSRFYDLHQFQRKPKCENDIKSTTRKDSYGNTRFFRGGKEFRSKIYADGSRDSHGAEMKNKAKLDAASAEKQRRRDEAQRAHALRKPSFAPRAP